MMARIEKWDEVHGNQVLDEKMMAFLDSTTDQYAILQLRRSEDTVYERFSSMRELERMGLEPDIDHYEVVYTAPLLPYKDQNTMLEELYAKFNVSRPNDFTGHSLSAAISALYLESADAAIPVGTFAGYAFRSWLRHLFCGSGELDGCVLADPD